MVYEWKASARMNTDAAKVGEELAKLGEQITPAAVIAAARKNKRSELHKCFEWDDGAAAEKYRLEQARYMLRMIVVREEIPARGTQKSQNVAVRVYECISPSRESKERAYMPTRKVLADPELRCQVLDRLDNALAEAQHTLDVYSYLIGDSSEISGAISIARKGVIKAKLAPISAPLPGPVVGARA
jgi:hypothetical protein